MSEAVLLPSPYRPPYQIERRIERLKMLRELYALKLAAVKAELQELERFVEAM